VKELCWTGIPPPNVIARRNDVAIPYLQSGPANWGLPRYARNDAFVIRKPVFA